MEDSVSGWWQEYGGGMINLLETIHGEEGKVPLFFISLFDPAGFLTWNNGVSLIPAPINWTPAQC